MIDHLVTATGSAGTQAGLVAGLKAMNAGIPLLGIGVRAPKDKQEENVFTLAVRDRRQARLLRASCSARTWSPTRDYVGAGYGIPRAGHAGGDPDVRRS